MLTPTRAQHGSDSGTYDKEGRFVPQAFEDMFAKFDTTNSGSLSAGELWALIKGNRLAVDPFGVSCAQPRRGNHLRGSLESSLRLFFF